MRFRRSVIAAYCCACAVMILGAAGFRVAVERLNVFVVKKPVELRGPLATIPPTLGSWRRVGEDTIFGAALVEELGTTQYLDRTYALDGDPEQGIASVHVAYYTGAIDDVPHIPERCWDAAGMVMTRPPEVLGLAIDESDWTLEPEIVNLASGEPYRSVEVRHPVTGMIERVYMPVGPIEMTVSEFRPAASTRERQTGGYFFIANGRPTASAFGVRRRRRASGRILARILPNRHRNCRFLVYTIAEYFRFHAICQVSACASTRTAHRFAIFHGGVLFRVNSRDVVHDRHLLRSNQ